MSFFTSVLLKRVHECAISLAILATCLCHTVTAQAGTLSLGSASGQPGAVISVPVSFTAGTTSSAGVMWTFAYVPADVSSVSVDEGTASTNAGKNISCNSTGAGRYTCIAYGMNATAIPTGILATAKFTLSSSTSATSTSIQITNTVGVTPTGSPATDAGSGGSITIVRPIALSALTCSATTLAAGDSSVCTVSLTASATSNMAVSLGYIASGANITMPTSVTVPNGSKTAQFTVKVNSATTATTLKITASAAGVTKTDSISISLTPTISVSVSPSSVTLSPAQTKQFAAAVTGTTNTAVTWSISPAVGKISTTGLYTAPSTVTSKQTITVKATSVANTAKYDTSTIVVNPPATAISVSVSPSSVTLSPAQTKQFAAAVTGTTNTAVTWSISPAVGKISTTGLYTAPSTVTSKQTITVKATSVANTAKYDTSIVVVNPPATDTTDPVISSVVATPNATSAVITWTTNEPASSRIEFGTTASWMMSVASSATLVTSHRLTLSGLKPSTTYYYRVRSTDGKGNEALSPATGYKTFKTLAATSMISGPDGPKSMMAMGLERIQAQGASPGMEIAARIEADGIGDFHRRAVSEQTYDAAEVTPLSRQNTLMILSATRLTRAATSLPDTAATQTFSQLDI